MISFRCRAWSDRNMSICHAGWHLERRPWGYSGLCRSLMPQATEEVAQAVGHAAGHLGRLTLRLPRDDTDVSWTSCLFPRSGSQCPAGLQPRNA